MKGNDGEEEIEQIIEIEEPIAFRLGGKSDRVDFQLQGGVIDNEYISAVSAHSKYFTSIDLQSFIVHLVEKNDTPVSSEEWKEIQSNLQVSNIAIEEARAFADTI